MKKEDVNTFSITFKTTNEAYIFMMDWINSYPNDIEIISDRILPDTKFLHDNDPVFRKLVSASKKANDAKLDYINKCNK